MWKLRDVVIMVILSIVCGLIFRIWDAVTPFITMTWVPGQGIINGLWWIAAGLIPYIIRRPGAALIAEVVAAVVEFALGGPYGAAGILSGIIQGIGAEIAFALFAWRKYNAWILMLSGILAGFGFSLQWYFQYDGYKYTPTVILLYVVMTAISGAILGGLLPKWMADALNRIGILRNFEIGRQTRVIQR